MCISTSGSDLFTGYSQFIYPQNSYFHPSCYVLRSKLGLDVSRTWGQVTLNMSITHQQLRVRLLWTCQWLGFRSPWNVNNWGSGCFEYVNYL